MPGVVSRVGVRSAVFRAGVFRAAVSRAAVFRAIVPHGPSRAVHHTVIIADRRSVDTPVVVFEPMAD